MGHLEKKPKIVWDISKPKGDTQRVMDMARAQAMGFKPRIALKDGIKEVMDWYQANREKTQTRYDVFK